jgi:hypothetical protein
VVDKPTTSSSSSSQAHKWEYVEPATWLSMNEGYELAIH